MKLDVARVMSSGVSGRVLSWTKVIYVMTDLLPESARLKGAHDICKGFRDGPLAVYADNQEPQPR